MFSSVISPDLSPTPLSIQSLESGMSSEEEEHDGEDLQQHQQQHQQQQEWAGARKVLRAQAAQAAQARAHVIRRTRSTEVGSSHRCPEHSAAQARRVGGVEGESDGERDGEQGYDGVEDEDDDEEHDDFDDGPIGGALKLVGLYAIGGGVSADDSFVPPLPQQLQRLMLRRRCRGRARAFGLRALRALLRTLSPLSTLQDALLPLRHALCSGTGHRSKTSVADGDASEGGATTTAVDQEGASADEISVETQPRHHYLNGLEGCEMSEMAVVQRSFVALFRTLAGLLTEAHSARNSSVVHTIMLCWALDFESRDCGFLHRVGLVQKLHSMMSLRSLSSLARARLDDADMAAKTQAQALLSGKEQRARWERQRVLQRAGWAPWAAASVRAGFLNGTLTKRAVAIHLSAAPQSLVPRDWLSKFGYSGQPRRMAQTLTYAQLLDVCEKVEALLAARAERRQSEIAEAAAHSARRKARHAREERDRAIAKVCVQLLFLADDCLTISVSTGTGQMGPRAQRAKRRPR